MRSLTAALSAFPAGSPSLTSAAASFLRRRALHKTMMSLEELEDHLLRDIGLTRGDLAVMRRSL